MTFWRWLGCALWRRSCRVAVGSDDDDAFRGWLREQRAAAEAEAARHRAAYRRQLLDTPLLPGRDGGPR